MIKYNIQNCSCVCVCVFGINKRSVIQKLEEMDLAKKSTKPVEYKTDVTRFIIFERNRERLGVPLTILENVRDRATKVQWANARVSSFLTRGCTCFTGDFDLLESLLTKKNKSKKLLKFLN